MPERPPQRPPEESSETSRDIAPSEILPKPFPNIHKEEAVGESVQSLRSEGQKVPETKAGRIDAHFRRIDRALEKKPGLFMRLVKKNLLAEHTLDILDEAGKEDEAKVAKLVRGLFESEKEILRRRGQGAELEKYGDVPRPEDVPKYREELLEKRAAQERGLSEWVEYLGGPDGEAYPTWYKYYVLRSLTSMGKRVRGSEATDTQAAVPPGYTKRSKTTIQPFPTLDRGALGSALDEIKASIARKWAEEESKKAKGEAKDTQGATRPLTELQDLADKGDFAKIYAHLQDRNERIRRERELQQGTKGEWRTYKQGDTDAMVADLKGKGTEWCIEGREVANNYLNGGEFHIYYTEDSSGNAVDPRVAIRLQQGSIAEVRGVLDKDQNLESQFTDIAREKYKEFPGNERFEKADRDMKRLTAIEEKVKREEDLTTADLRFLYEIDQPIDGFGYEKDPRVAEIRAGRNPREDAPLILECEPNQIAWSELDIRPDTKAYIGPLFKGVFELPQLEHLYTSFPEQSIRRFNLEIGGKTPEQYETEIERQGHRIYDQARDILKKVETAKEKTELGLVRLTVRDLGLTSSIRFDKLCERAAEFGLELVPAETGPALRLSMKDQPFGDWVVMAMKPLTDRDDDPGLFSIGRNGVGSWLRTHDGIPDDPWFPVGSFVFRSRKP